MQIQYYGLTCFKVMTRPGGRATEELTLYFDPIASEKGIRSVYGRADAVFFSESGAHDVSGLKEDPVIFDIPGEYSFKGMNVIALNTTSEGSVKENTSFVIETEDLRIAHLGTLQTTLTDKQLEKIDGVDILFIPVGGSGETLDGKQAAELARKIQPAVLIPMHYQISTVGQKLESAKHFCDEIGNCQKMPKFTVKAKELEGKNLEVIELDSLR